MDSKTAKWLKLGAVVALMAAAFGIYAMRSGDPNARSNRVQFVCVETGKTFWFNRGEHSKILPLKNPETGQETLIPCADENGQLTVSSRCRGLVKDLTKQKRNKFVDADSLIVKAQPTP